MIRGNILPRRINGLRWFGPSDPTAPFPLEVGSPLPPRLRAFAAGLDRCSELRPSRDAEERPPKFIELRFSIRTRRFFEKLDGVFDFVLEIREVEIGFV